MVAKVLQSEFSDFEILCLKRFSFLWKKVVRVRCTGCFVLGVMNSVAPIS